jgi:hypothetical protein
MSKKSKKVVQSPQKESTPRKPFPKRLLWIGLAVVAAGVAVWKFWPGEEEVYKLGKMHGVEETLTAKTPLLQLLEPAETGIDFQNQIVETKANNFATNVNIYNGGGVAIGDFNNDNLPDIYFICTNGQNRLYQNQGNLKFKDITQSAGLASEEGFETAAAAIDINADGFLDLYVCRAGNFENEERRNKLYINNGNLTFTERAKEYGLDDKSASTGANFFDGDGDGDLDLYLLNYPKDMVFANKIESKQLPDGTMIANLAPKDPLDSDRFYRNDGGKFTDVSQQSGIWNRGFGLSVSMGDLNRDGAPDIYVANDFLQPDRMYINNGKGVFTDELDKRIRHNTQFSMGTDISDFDNDGLIDIYAVDMMPANNYRHKTLKISNTNSLYLSLVQNGILEPVTHNVLQRNNGNGTFSDIACQAGVYRTDWSWSNLIADFDNDGLRDIYVSNGYRREIHHIDHAEFMKIMKNDKGGTQQIIEQFKTLEGYLNSVPSYKIRDFLFQNKGDWKFEDKGGEWATMKATWSCGAAWTDLDLDGDLDLVVNNLEDPAFVFKNQAREQNKGNFIQAKLKGSTQNPFAVGASVLIEYGNGKIQYQEISPNRGIFSCSEHLIHFGMGQESQITKLSVRWPDGKTQVMNNVPVNQRLQLDYANASGYVASLVPITPAQNLITENTAGSGVNFVHKESKFNDFENYPLMVWMESELGPLTAAADVNGDGLEDFFVGNAFNAPAALYVQNPDGSFKPSNQALWDAEKAYEDHGAVFFDFDGDKDQDLFVVSGGFDAPAQGRDKLWQNRLYLNDGKGNFAKANGAVPTALGDIGLRVVAHDYDKDGDADLFVGGRLVPDKWPLTPRSLILRNDGNKLTDVTEEVGGDFARCGMVTDLAWADLDKDGQAELVAVGEWMPVSVFKMNGGKLSNITEQLGLGKSNGLWFSLKLADVDQDGDTDLITGNFGINTRFTTSPDAPFSCYAKDFDNNGTLDPIVTMFEGKNSFPLVQKEVMVKQIPSLKKKYLYAISYSQTPIEEMWGSGLKDALKLVANDMETCWWENQGGKMVRHSLPYQVQISAIQGIVAEDLNGDGHLDLLMAGNKYGMEVGTGRYDAGNGVFLAGDGKGNFTWVNNLQSGFWAMRDARDLAIVKGANGKRTFVVANNNSALQVFR